MQGAQSTRVSRELHIFAGFRPSYKRVASGSRQKGAADKAVQSRWQQSQTATETGAASVGRASVPLSSLASPRLLETSLLLQRIAHSAAAARSVPRQATAAHASLVQAAGERLRWHIMCLMTSCQLQRQQQPIILLAATTQRTSGRHKRSESLSLSSLRSFPFTTDESPSTSHRNRGISRHKSARLPVFRTTNRTASKHATCVPDDRRHV